MNANANATAPVPSATAKKQPAWMALPTMDDLNEYLKKARIGGERAEGYRRKWSEAVHGPADDATVKNAMTRTEDTPVGEDAVTVKEAEHAPGHAIPPTPAKDNVKPMAPAKVDRAATQAGALRTRYVDPLLIDVKDGWNARVDFGDLAELKESIRAQKRLDGHGLVNDVRIKEKADGRYELVDGERRLTCVLGLIDEGEVFEFGIPAKVEPADTTDAALIIKMFVANGGKPFLPYEEALYYDRLRKSPHPETGKPWTIAQIEQATGRSDNSIVGALALLEADDDLVDAIIKGEIGASLGKSIAVNVRGNKTKQKELTAKAKAAKKTGDKKAMKQVHREIDDSRRAKAAKKAPKLQLKARKADEAEIADLGTKTAARLKDLMEKLGLPFDTDMHEWISNDRELQIAANFGALEALKSVMGVKVKVEF